MSLPAYLPASKQPLVVELVQDLNANALSWLSGYFAGVAAEREHPGGAAQAGLPVAAPAADPSARLTVVFGSQTGNAKRVAEQLAQAASSQGLAVRLLRADQYPVRELKDERLLYVVISTQGEGDPPDDAMGFVEFLNSRRAPKLPQLKFGVLGLGDSSYPLFCGIAQAIDQRLEALGGSRVHPVGMADLDIDSVAGPWKDAALAKARDVLQVTALPSATVTPLHPRARQFGRDHPFAAEVLQNQGITGRGSSKDIRHIELSLESSGLAYQPGDALGIWPEQSVQLVEQVLAALGLDGATPVAVDDVTRPLSEWLAQHRELTVITRPFLAAHAERSADSGLQATLQPGGEQALRDILANWQLIDLLTERPAAWTADALVRALRPLAPRLYSIASSQALVGDEVHLTVAHVAYERDGQPRWGAASHCLAGLAEGDAVRVFIEPNDRFRLPADPSRDVIMIGPGTGVAPFRAFAQQRQAAGAGGRHWLFFGNPHFHTDFLYQTEWQQALRDGTLDRLDLAFSRDQAHKVYVQDKLREQGADVFAWISGGAHVYVCGDATRMARDVHAALLDIGREHGGLDADAAGAWLADLAAQGRYARDVY